MSITQLLAVDPNNPSPDVLAFAAAILRRGGLVAFPTETVYGLGANALDAEAVARIFAAKGRPSTNPVIVHVATLEEARALVNSWPEVATRLAERFWPGPLTLVLPRRSIVPDIVTASGPTVAIRIPSHPVALALLKATGLPIAAPSANRSTELSPTRAAHVLHGLDGRIDLLLDGGPTTGGLESTVLDVTTSPPRLLRPGLVTPLQIEALIGPIQLGSTSTEHAILPSPGMMARHYSPRTPLELTDDSGCERVRILAASGVRVAWMPLSESEDVAGVWRETMSNDPSGYATELYATLHALDAMGYERIVVELPPERPEWLAVRDRLRRAAEK